jgi:hypothetical protein
MANFAITVDVSIILTEWQTTLLLLSKPLAEREAKGLNIITSSRSARLYI